MQAATATVAACCVAYLAQLAVPGGGRALYLLPRAVLAGDWWPLLTSMFLHASVMHLAANMVSLWIMSRALCEWVSVGEWALACLGGGVAGGLAYVALAGDVPAVGASGAVFGLMGLYAALLVGLRGRVPNARRMLVAWVAIAVLSLGITEPGVGWQAHLGGFAFGVAVGLVAGVGRKEHAG